MIKKLIGLLSTLAVFVVLVLTVLLVGARFVGLTPYSVLSGSMEPTYSAGDLLYVREVAPEEIEIGMPITYVANEHLVIATHRVVDIYKKTTTLEPIVDSKGQPAVGRDGNPIMQEVPLEQPMYYFKTQGDANDAKDAVAVYEKNVIGTPVYHVPYLGHFVTMLKTPAGKVMAGCFGLMIVILMFLPEMMQWFEPSQKKQEEAASDAQEDDGEEKADEDEIVCDEKAGSGDDVVVPEREDAGGDDILLKAKGAGEGDDVVIEEGKESGADDSAENKETSGAAEERKEDRPHEAQEKGIQDLPQERNKE